MIHYWNVEIFIYLINLIFHYIHNFLLFSQFLYSQENIESSYWVHLISQLFQSPHTGKNCRPKTGCLDISRYVANHRPLRTRIWRQIERKRILYLPKPEHLPANRLAQWTISWKNKKGRLITLLFCMLYSKQLRNIQAVFSCSRMRSINKSIVA